eukprot:TRINITY_DN12247_c0_g1_i3.p1 TRINITY_DN12247_c0_g1~~TRINITY_DN12247_c0_g1_i3.p1  ORF type:complete len:304 (-),score=44.43 TRINITY_DN12247_c0_g1_i3:45-956(-)
MNFCCGPPGGLPGSSEFGHHPLTCAQISLDACTRQGCEPSTCVPGGAGGGLLVLHQDENVDDFSAIDQGAGVGSLDDVSGLGGVHLVGGLSGASALAESSRVIELPGESGGESHHRGRGFDVEDGVWDSSHVPVAIDEECLFDEDLAKGIQASMDAEAAANVAESTSKNLPRGSAVTANKRPPLLSRLFRPLRGGYREIRARGSFFERFALFAGIAFNILLLVSGASLVVVGIVTFAIGIDLYVVHLVIGLLLLAASCVLPIGTVCFLCLQEKVVQTELERWHRRWIWWLGDPEAARRNGPPS